MGEELYEQFTGETGITYTTWPVHDESKLILDESEIVVQMNGKVRAKFMASSDIEQAEILKMAYEQEGVIRHLEGMKVVKEIVIKNKIVNLVIKPQ